MWPVRQTQDCKYYGTNFLHLFFLVSRPPVGGCGSYGSRAVKLTINNCKCHTFQHLIISNAYVIEYSHIKCCFPVVTKYSKIDKFKYLIFQLIWMPPFSFNSVNQCGVCLPHFPSRNYDFRLLGRNFPLGNS